MQNFYFKLFNALLLQGAGPDWGQSPQIPI